MLSYLWNSDKIHQSQIDIYISNINEVIKIQSIVENNLEISPR